jgi:hypothetical protein
VTVKNPFRAGPDRFAPAAGRAGLLHFPFAFSFSIFLLHFPFALSICPSVFPMRTPPEAFFQKQKIFFLARKKKQVYNSH